MNWLLAASRVLTGDQKLVQSLIYEGSSMHQKQGGLD